jgi:hypothetical protein
VQEAQMIEFKKIGGEYIGYWADNEGNIWSSKRMTGGKGNGPIFKIEEEPILKKKPSIDRYGYHRVRISVNGKQSSIRVHTLVLLAFHGPKPFKNAICRHLDGNKSNNQPNNLRWGTYKENAQDMIDHGFLGMNDFNTNFTKDDILEIRSTKYYPGLFNDLAEKYDATPSSISNAYYGKTFEYLGDTNKIRIDEQAVLDIRSRKKTYGLFAELARKYNVTPENIARIYNYETWKHVGTNIERNEHHIARFTDDQVQEIRSHKEYRGLCSDLAKEHGVHKETIRHIRARKTYKHVK